MDFSKPYIWNLMMYGIKCRKQAAEFVQLISSVFGEETVWAHRTGLVLSICPGDNYVKHLPQTGRPSGPDGERLLQLVEDDLQQTKRQLAEVLRYYNQS